MSPSVLRAISNAAVTGVSKYYFTVIGSRELEREEVLEGINRVAVDFTVGLLTVCPVDDGALFRQSRVAECSC